ncbi:MAG: hypothetical protein O2887_18605 [Bacteroidetes bacterium]|nr:hypothetical protein [Bacteroidota bacterium]MDA1122467.1 hypothetical protein [Bacteroidota bacterium]
MNIRSLFGIFALIFYIAGCGESDKTPVDEITTSSWEVIQTQIFKANCVVCHSDGTSFARQSDLILTKDAAYNNLIDRAPKNAAAAADGLMLLETKGLESLYTSFLWEKINASDQEHFYEDHAEYGEMMPLGLPSLTNGELEYIRKWIIAGAPEVGLVADETLLDDSTRFETPNDNFEALLQPESGVQLHLGPFEVQPNFERELFEFQVLGNTQDLFVKRIEITMRKGSHHFIFYDFEPGTSLPTANEIRDVRDENNRYIISTLEKMTKHVFVFGTQLRNTDYTYPEGVALRVPAGKGFDLNAHYANYSDEIVTGELYINLNTIDQSEVQHLAQKLFLSEQDFALPPQQESSVTANYTFNEKRTIFMLTSHAHQHMKEFRISIIGGPKDGQLVYFTNDWEHPVLLEYDPPIVLNPGEGLRGDALYYNDTDNTLRFGLLSVEEMMIIFGSYYTD